MNLSECLDYASRQTGVPPASILVAVGHKAKAARNLVMFFLHVDGEMSMRKIGALLGVDFTTVRQAVKRVERDIYEEVTEDGFVKYEF